MERSTSTLLHRLRSGSRAKLLALTVFGAVVLYDSSAYAINAIISQDVPILSAILAEEVKTALQLGTILAQVGVMVTTVKEYTTIAKTAWAAVNELRHMSLKDLGGLALKGVKRAFPEVGDIYGDIKDIKDLNYTNFKAQQTLRGMLWEEVYGPAIDYLHTGHKNLESLSAMEEHRIRSGAKVGARRMQAEGWEEDCARTSSKGQGACRAASYRASIQQALLLADMNETALHSLEAQQLVIEQNDRKELDQIYTFDRWAHDLNNYFAAGSGQRSCRAGDCLYDRYGSKMYEKIAEFRERHPQNYETRIRLTN